MSGRGTPGAPGSGVGQGAQGRGGSDLASPSDPGASIPDLLSPGGRVTAGPTRQGAAGRAQTARSAEPVRSGHSEGHAAQTAEDRDHPEDGVDDRDSASADNSDRDDHGLPRFRHPLWDDHGERASSDGLLGLLGALGEKLQDLN